ncbi:MAG: DUF1194 domain-containing protein [Alphaproteobacteria bacterium]|jgi:hypothetical protein|nr:DUF1194 domain-containing protein [Alphaproteobacteria bacterium]
MAMLKCFNIWFAGCGHVAALLTCLTAASSARGQAALTVDLALVLAIDCSNSVDLMEYDLQTGGLANAFRSSEIIAAIASGPTRRIGVTVVQWADSYRQMTVVPWHIVSNRQSALLLADEIARTPRYVHGGSTSITGMMTHGYQLLSRIPFAAHRKAIDITADGRNNEGGSPGAARDRLSAKGITINGLAILNEIQTLDLYFQRNVIGGPGNFVIRANDYEDFRVAIWRKLLREILGPGIALKPNPNRHQAALPARLAGRR